MILAVHAGAFAGGLFGPPQTVSRTAGGLNTAIGYQYHEDTYKHHTNHVLTQNQIYSQASYGASDIWEIYGRIGAADLKMSDAFSSTHPSTVNIGNDFHEYWRLFGTLGAKGFYPINKFFGVGAFVQGSYNIGKYADETAVLHNGTFYVSDLEIKNLWDVNIGLGVQATVPFGIKLYGGPYIYYAEADARLSGNIPGIPFGTEKTLLKNDSLAGGYFGVDIPLIRGFRLNIEGQYTNRFSVGSAITYTY